MRIGIVSSERGLRTWCAIALTGLWMGAAGCGGTSTGTDAGMGGDAPMSADVEIEGTYSDGFATHVIEGSRWTMSGMDFMSGFTITHVDNDADFAIAQNDATNAFSPGLFSRFEWVTVGGDLYMCQSPFDAPTQAAALEAARPDRANPAMTGCGMFGWSLMAPAPAP